MRIRAPVGLALLAGTVLLVTTAAPGPALAQDEGPLAGVRGRLPGIFQRTNESDTFDRWDILLIEQGRVVLGYGNGKLFGFDVRKAMGNPAKLNVTTRIKWQQAISNPNHSVLLIAVRYPPDLYPDGVVLEEKVLTEDLGRMFDGWREEEYIDFAAWMIRAGYMSGSTEEDALRVFETLGYIGGAAAVANMLASNQVNMPVTFNLHKGEYRGKPYDVRMKVQLARFGFGDVSKARMRSQVRLRRPNFADLRVDTQINGIFAPHPETFEETVSYDLRRLGTYSIGAEQPWDADNESRGFKWHLGAAIDFVTPTEFEDSRVRTGFQVNFDRGTKVPELYFVEFYERYRLGGGRRDVVMQGRGGLLVNGVRYEGLQGEIRANFLLGSTAPRVAGAGYSADDWDRFSRIYLQAKIDALEKGKDDYSFFVAYAAPFDIDIAVERGFLWWLRRRTQL